MGSMEINTVMTEPDTEVATSDQSNLNTVTGVTQLVQQALTTLQDAGVTNVQIGTGAGTLLANYASTVGRDPFSFWAPIDTAFLQATVNFAKYQQLAFIFRPIESVFSLVLERY